MERENDNRSRDNFCAESRFLHTVNSRHSMASGLPMPTVATEYSDGSIQVIKRISEDSVPFNFLPIAVGAAAVKKVIFKGDQTIVIFDGGERVTVTRSKNDKYDEPTAVAWALLKFCFGKNYNRQIHRIIDKVGIRADKIHSEKKSHKDKAFRRGNASEGFARKPSAK
jgi:hypothetical protein